AACSIAEYNACFGGPGSVLGPDSRHFSRPGNPTRGRIGLLTQDEVQLRRVVLHVAQVVEEQLGHAEAGLRRRLGLKGPLLIESFDHLVALPTAVLEVGLKLSLRIGTVREQNDWTQPVPGDR